MSEAKARMNVVQFHKSDTQMINKMSNVGKANDQKDLFSAELIDVYKRKIGPEKRLAVVKKPPLPAQAHKKAVAVLPGMGPGDKTWKEIMKSKST
jgi:hypothetical protein